MAARRMVGTVAMLASMDIVTWRAAAPSDAVALADLFRTITQVAPVGMETTAGEVESRLHRPRLDWDRDTMVGVDATGQALAYAEAADMGVGQGRFRVRLTAAVHPELDHEVTRRSVDWLVARATRMRNERHPDLPGVAGARCAATDRRRLALLADAGFEIAQWEQDLVRAVDQPLPAGPVPDGLTIVPYDMDRDEAVRVAHNDAYAEDPNALLPDAQSWPQHAIGLPEFLPNASFLALAGEPGEQAEQIAGFLFSLERRDLAGAPEGSLHCLATRKPWRRRGLASCLITRALNRFQEAGYDRARLQTRSTNQDAGRLYSRLGFTDSGRGFALLHAPLP